MRRRYVAGACCYHIVSETMTKFCDDGEPHLLCHRKPLSTKIIIGKENLTPMGMLQPIIICKSCQRKVRKPGEAMRCGNE